MTTAPPVRPRRIRLATAITIGLQLALFAALLSALWTSHWFDAFVAGAVLAMTFAPLLIGRRFAFYLPPELEFLVIVFIFASLFLGEVHGYYVRYWWWDVALHTGSGLLLGSFGFLLVFVLNRDPAVRLRMNPKFVALFSFMFAVALGALWEIFEFAMDQWFGLNMQKSGLVDTMWDLIVDTLGALVMSSFGWLYLARHMRSPLARRLGLVALGRTQGEGADQSWPSAPSPPDDTSKEP